ncbi:uncharacterized protein LOC142339100 isoform X2 [Convolutriloba macropyga]
MSDQPLLCKPALQQEVTGSLNIDYSLMASVHQNPATGHFMSNGDSMSFGDRTRSPFSSSSFSSSSSSSSHWGSSSHQHSSQYPIKIVKSSGRNYGSFSSTACTDSFLLHVVEPGETLQAISLKYNITIEQLKRINKLTTNEAFFLKETILIPCPDVIPTNMTLVSQDGAHTLNDQIHSLESKQRKTQNKSKQTTSSPSKPVSINKSQNPSSNLSTNGHPSNCDRTQNGQPTMRGNTPPSPDISDIFKKFDTMLEVTKSNVEKLQQNSACMSYSSSSESLFNLQNKTATVSHSSTSKEKNIGSKTAFFPESKRHDELFEL